MFSGIIKFFNIDKVMVILLNGLLFIVKWVMMLGIIMFSLNVIVNLGDVVLYIVMVINNYNISFYGLVLCDFSSNNLGSFSSSNVFGFIKLSSLRVMVSGVSGVMVLYCMSNLNIWVV